MTGLLLKAWRETWWTTALIASGVFVFEGLLTYILPQVQADMLNELWLQMPFVKTMLTALLGTDVGDTITGQVLQSFNWVHPVILALVWAHVIIIGTRFPVGEIDRGTIDVLLSWPVSRRRVYLAETMVWLVSAAFVLVMALLGNRVMGVLVEPDALSPLGPVLLVLVNFAALALAVAGGTFLVAALSNRRGRAIGTIFAIVVASFLLNFLGQFWEPADRVSFLSFLDYYRPVRILSSGTLPVRDVLVLVSVGVALWLIGGEVLVRRSVCTV